LWGERAFSHRGKPAHARTGSALRAVFTTGAAVMVKAPSGKGKRKPFCFSSNYLNPENKNMNHD